MTDVDHGEPADPNVSAVRLCISLGLFMLCNLICAAVIPLIAMMAD